MARVSLSGDAFLIRKGGHKAAGCGWWVSEVDTAEGQAEGEKTSDVGACWVVAGVDEQRTKVGGRLLGGGGNGLAALS